MKDTSLKGVIELAIDKINLDTLVHLIIDNAELNYSKDELRITNETTLLQFIKYIYPNTYKNKLEVLKAGVKTEDI